MIGNREININDENPAIILANQNPETLGIHDLQGTGIALKKLAAKDVDVILMDAHMDLGARLWSDKEGRFPFFMRQDLAPMVEKKWVQGDFLDPKVAAANNAKIAHDLKQKFARAHVIFLHFPHSAYGDASARTQRTIAFCEEFNAYDIRSIPLTEVDSSEFTNSASHFKPSFYDRMAGMCTATIG